MTKGAIAGLGAAIWLLASCSVHKGQIPDSALLPLPDELTLENSHAGDCGSGNQFECGRTFVLTSVDGSQEDTLERSLSHLTEIGGWQEFEPLESGSRACVDDDEYCVSIEPFEWNCELFSEESQRWSSRFGIPESEIPRLVESAVEISFSDWRGDTIDWPG